MKKIIIGILIICFSPKMIPAQEENRGMSLDNRIHGLTTLIITNRSGNENQGSGFFYQQLEQKDPLKKDEGQWRKIENLWLVTNRHVALLKDKRGNEYLPDKFTFHLRKVEGGNIVWEPINISKNELKKRLRIHSNKNVDIAVIDIFDLVTDKFKTGDDYMAYHAVSAENLPGENKINIEVTDDVVTIGYPKGFYDEVNVFPIVKQGIIASKWGSSFNGNPYFLIDSKLFPGSSGSIVISKPKDFIIEEGQMFHSASKQFAFLGIFSGEPYKIQPKSMEFEDMVIFKKDGFDVGIVWYSSLVIEIIERGVQLK